MRALALPLGRSAAVPLAEALRRATSPAFYLAVFGGLQVVYLWVLAAHVGFWIPAIGTIGLFALLASLMWHGSWRWKELGLLALIALTTVGPAVVSMTTRVHVGLTVEHDGLLQTEAAIDRLINGQPIYGVDWSGTEMSRVPWTPPPSRNPALSHNAYFPLTVLVGVPIRLLAGAAGIPFDYRMVLVGFLLIALGAVQAFPIAAPARFMVATALFLNPLVALFFWSGRNDVAYVAMLLVGLAFLSRDRAVPAAGAFGIAAALKPFAALALPFVALVLWIRWQGRPELHLREVLSAAVALAAAPVLTITPFLLADRAAFWRDTVLYMNGGLPDAYPIGGFGFGAILLALGVVGHRTDSFPFSLFQLAAMLPVLWIGGRALCRRPTLGTWMAGYVSLFLAFSFFGRFFNDNYLGTVFALAACIPALGRAPLAAPTSGPVRPAVAWR